MNHVLFYAHENFIRKMVRSLPSLLRRPSQCMSWMATCLMGMLLPSHASALQEADAYVVPDVTIDIAAGSIASARQEALISTRTDAFRLLLTSLTLTEDHERLPEIAISDIRLFALGLDINEERFTQDNYFARMTWRFDKPLVQELLSQLSIPFVASDAGKVVILPLYRQAGISLLWDSANPWLQAWKHVPVTSPFYRHSVPENVPSELVGKEEATNPTEDLAALAHALEAQHLVVAILQPTLDTEGKINLLRIEVLEYHFSVKQLPPDHVSMFLSRKQGEHESAFFIRAAEKTHATLEERWKRLNLYAPGDDNVVGRIKVKVFYQGFADWIRMKERVEKNPVISRVNIVSLSRDYALLDAYVAASLPIFRRQLSSQGMELFFHQEDKLWLLFDSDYPCPLREKEGADPC
ncbi:MAG: hypothetical protein GDA54_02835 [Alphaproteobacteria bacterium GM7ARS4]|nr:hypothetical protein [Alphaproteobacteria bacterium GM7ARS4]